MLAKYRELRIDPKTKYLVFSDALDVDKAAAIKEYCDGKIRATFGIGTNLTNDVGHGIKPMNIVMKLFACKLDEKMPWQDTVKLSDSVGKHTGEPEEIDLAMRVLRIEE